MQTMRGRNYSKNWLAVLDTFQTVGGPRAYNPFTAASSNGILKEKDSKKNKCCHNDGNNPPNHLSIKGIHYNLVL